MSVGILLLTGLTARTELPVMWAWMFITGVGIGPTLSVFTIVIQSVVPFDRLGVATGNLTFFRQVGGSVGLAVVGTLFAESFASRLVPSMQAAGVPTRGRLRGRDVRERAGRHHPGRRGGPVRAARAGAGAPGPRRPGGHRHPRRVLARDRGYVLARPRHDASSPSPWSSSGCGRCRSEDSLGHPAARAQPRVKRQAARWRPGRSPKE